MEITKELLDEWFEHPVTDLFKDLINHRYEVAQNSRDAVYIAGEPFKTSENHAYLNGGSDSLDVIASCLEEKLLSNLIIWDEDENVLPFPEVDSLLEAEGYDE